MQRAEKPGQVLLLLLLLVLPVSQAFIGVEIGSVDFSLLMLLATLLAPLSLLQYWLGAKKYVVRPQDIALLCLCIFYSLWVVEAEDPVRSGYMTIHGLLIPCLLYWLVKIQIQTEAEFLAAKYALCLGALVAGSIGTIMLLYSAERPQLTGLPPLGLATLLVYPCVIAVSGGMQLPKTPAVLDWGLRGLVLAAMVSTLSRVYLLLVIVCRPVMYFLSRVPKLIWVSMIVVSLGLTLSITSSIGNISAPERFRGDEEGFERLVSPTFIRQGIYKRAKAYEKALVDFVESPVVGTGIKRGYTHYTPHNFHIEWLQYGGIVGYLLYCSAILLHVKSVGAYWRVDMQLLQMGTAMFIIALNSLTNGIMHGIIPHVFLLLMGMSEARLRLLVSTESGP